MNHHNDNIQKMKLHTSVNLIMNTFSLHKKVFHVINKINLTGEYTYYLNKYQFTVCFKAPPLH
jgi:hypothetical protein